MTAAKSIRIGLWGTTQVGKTALLATALFGGANVFRNVIRADDKTSINSYLFRAYRQLQNNRLVPQTASRDVSVSIAVGDTEVHLVDVAGQIVLEIDTEGVRSIVRGCDAMLFLFEYDGQSQGDQIAAIQGASVEMGDKPVALALTKCERRLTRDDPIWQRPRNWLRSTPMWPSHSSTLGRFTDRAWPTSAFGYDAETGLPAIMLGEMGQMLPFRIQPRNVAEPLVFLLEELGCL
jgi:hypothetical protein